MPSYEVSVFDYSTSEWKVAETTILCYDFIENNAMLTSYKDCNLHV